MKPILTQGATHNYGPPAKWDQKADGPCGVLSVRMQPYGETKHSECISTWKPSKAEIKLLVDGGVVILSVVAGVQPPVALWAEAVEDEDAGRPLEGQGPVTAEEDAADDALEAALTHEDNLKREPDQVALDHGDYDARPRPEAANDGG